MALWASLLLVSGLCSTACSSNRCCMADNDGRRITMASELPNFSRFYENEQLSDVDIIIREDVQGISGCSNEATAQHELVLPGHSLLLATFSNYCSIRLDNYSDFRPTKKAKGSTAAKDSSNTAKYTLELLVPPSQLETGRMLVQGMYEPRPDFSSTGQGQLLQLLVLADRYEVPKVIKAVCAVLQGIPHDQLQWETVLGVYKLPAGCADLEAFKGAYAAAAAKVQQQLGDLEVVWADDTGSKQQQMYGLPYAALKQLLQTAGTRVASENTVFFTIEQWYDKQPAEERPPKKQMNELVQLVRIKHCSQLFVASRMCESCLAKQCFSQAELRLACLISGTTRADVPGRSSLFAKPDECPVLQKYPAWNAAQRPPSAIREVRLSWKLPLSHLKGLVQEVLQPGEMYSDTVEDAKIVISKGLHLQLQVQVYMDQLEGSEDDASPKKLYIGQFVRAGPLTGSSLASITYTLRMVAAAGGKDEFLARCTDLFSAAAADWGSSDMVQLGEVKAWEDVELVLQQKKLVHADGCLHLLAVVHDVL